MKLLLLLIFFPFICLSQKKADSLYIATMQTRMIKLEDKRQTISVTLPFTDVIVWDARPDTTSVGFLPIGGSDKTYKLKFEAGLANQLRKFANKNYTFSTGDSIKNLFVIIKNFRVSNYVISSIINNNITEWSSGIVLNAELFLNNGNTYRALYKIDTTIKATDKPETVAGLMHEGFKTVFIKAENKSLASMHIGKTNFSYDDIKNHVSTFSNIQILNDSVFNAGVYISFNEFKTNNPSIKKYELRKGKLSDELYVTDGKQTYPLQDFWGYCDGKSVYIRSAKNLFKLYRTGNTYNTVAFKSVSRRYTDFERDLVGAAASTVIGINVTPFIKNKYTEKAAAFQLNMQTGEIY